MQGGFDLGRLIEGQWHDIWYDTKRSGGKFLREDAQYRNWIGDEGFEAESGRYHLYVSYACPWAHRTIIFRKLKGLEAHIGMTSVHPNMLEHGWVYEPAEPNYGFDYHHQLYTKTKPDYSGRVTVPVLWDKKRETMVSNESSEIIRMFNHHFGDLAQGEDYYPQDLRAQIDAVNHRVYHDVNNGVYKCGFATSQSAYEAAYEKLFDALDWLEGLLGHTRYLTGDRMTEADWRLFTTLIRFDAVYHGHFKANKKRIEDYHNLSGFMRELYQVEGVAQTVKMDHIKDHYYISQRTINPSQVVPLGPSLDFTRPHNRGA